MPDATSGITIADAVDNLRTQIVEARERGKGSKGVKFALRELEVELQLVAERKDAVGGNVGFSFAVFTGGGSYNTEATTAYTHTIRFKLEVEDVESGKREVLMSDD